MGVLSSAWWPGGRTTANPFYTQKIRKGRSETEKRVYRTKTDAEVAARSFNSALKLCSCSLSFSHKTIAVDDALPHSGGGKKDHMNFMETGWYSISFYSGEKKNILHEVTETANGLAQLKATARSSDNTGIVISLAALVSFFLLIGA